MSHSYSSIRVHVIFSTKGRQKTLSDILQPKLWPYMAGIARNHGFEALKVGGVEDHTHALLLLSPTIPLAKSVQILKSCSSKWINDMGSPGRSFAWQEGYGAFSVSASQTEDVIRYINNQAAHHAKQSYEDEFLEMLKKYGLNYELDHVL